MPWPWPQLHHVYRAFEKLPEEQAQGEVRRMLRGLRREMIVEAFVFGALLWGMTSLGTCCSTGWALSSFTRIPAQWAFALSAVVGSIPAYFGATWRYQRLAARALDSRMTAYGDASWNICANCRYPLGGLPPHGECVVCPECGATHPLPAIAGAPASESIKSEPH